MQSKCPPPLDMPLAISGGQSMMHNNAQYCVYILYITWPPFSKMNGPLHLGKEERN